MPDSYQISDAAPRTHRGKRDSARRQACVVPRGVSGPAVATRGLVRLVGLCCGLGLVAGLSGCWVDSLLTGSGCTHHHDDTYDLQEPTDPATTLKIEDCRMDVGACDALCTLVLSQNDEGQTMTSCSVTFDGSTTHVDVGYDTQDDGFGCAVPFGDDEPLPEDAGGL
jgi:hypothetical protein